MMGRHKYLSNARGLGQIDLQRKVKIGAIAVPSFVILAGAAFIAYKLFQAAGSSGAGEAPDVPDVPPASGNCRDIQANLKTPIGCGRVKTTGYNAGKPYAIQLTEIPGFPGFYVQSHPTNVYAAVLRLFAAAKKDGINLRINSAFRTMASQIALRKQNCIGGKPTGRFVPCKPFTAQAGFSNHQEGTALDLQVGGQGSKAWNWLRANGKKYGFVDIGGKFGRPGYEPWHWAYKKEFDQFDARGVV